MDAHKNFAYSTVATAPSPASSGTSLVVAAGQGALFPAVPFNATIWPVSTQPLSSNAEIVRVTAISTDTLTITRAQESSSARTVVVGDQIAATVTKKTLNDVEVGGPTWRTGVTSGDWINPGIVAGVWGVPGGTLNRLYFVPFLCPATFTMTKMRIYVGGTVNVRLGIYNADGTNGVPGTLLYDAGVLAAVGAGDKTLSGLSQALKAGTWYWLALVEDASVALAGLSNAAMFPSYDGSLSPANGVATIAGYHAFTYAALPATASALTLTTTTPMIQVGA